MSRTTDTAALRFGDSKWIWPESLRWDLHNAYALFRKAFELKSVPASAPLYITADQSYQLYLNGRYVCRGPARGYQHCWPYDEVDVRPFLRLGRNVLAVRCHNPGFSNYQYITQGYAGLLVAAKWGALRLVSDKSWKGRRQAGLNRDTVQSSAQLYCQEHIDLREEDPRWMEPDYGDAGWTANVAEHPWNGMPWCQLEERGLPLLEETLVFPERCLGAASGESASGSMRTRDVTRDRYHEGLTHQKSEMSAENLIVLATGAGRYRSYLLDFGRTVVGSVGFHLLNAQGGEVIDTLHVETIDEATLTPHFSPDQYCRMAFGHRLICREGMQTHAFYHTFGFRYMVVTIRNSETTLTLRPFLRTTLYPLEKKGDFHSSDATLEQIWNACAWTQRVCSLDAYVDTPWREQAQWWGDANVQSKNTFFYSGDTRLFRRGIAQIAGQTVPNGLTYGHAPTMAHSCILPDFTLIWILTLWNYYWQTGSLEPLKAHEKTLFGALDYFESMTDAASGLVAYDPRYWLFLDWSGVFKEGYSTVYNLWLLIALDRMAILLRQIKNEGAAEKISVWAVRLRIGLNKLERNDGLLGDGLTFERQPVPTASIHAQTLAMMAGLNPYRSKQRLELSLLPFIRHQIKPEVTPSCYWITYVFEVLTEAGFGEDVILFIRDKWTPMAKYGTTWESFQPKVGDESFSHAWSSHPLSHLMQTIGGIRQSSVAWSEILFQPHFIGNDANVVVPTPKGLIRSEWHRKNGDIAVKLRLPPGVTARVQLPGQCSLTVTGDHSWVLDTRAKPRRSLVSLVDEAK